MPQLKGIARLSEGSNWFYLKNDQSISFRSRLLNKMGTIELLNEYLIFPNPNFFSQKMSTGLCQDTTANNGVAKSFPY